MDDRHAAFDVVGSDCTLNTLREESVVICARRVPDGVLRCPDDGRPEPDAVRRRPRGGERCPDDDVRGATHRAYPPGDRTHQRRPVEQRPDDVWPCPHRGGHRLHDRAHRSALVGSSTDAAVHGPRDVTRRPGDRGHSPPGCTPRPGDIDHRADDSGPRPDPGGRCPTAVGARPRDRGPYAAGGAPLAREFAQWTDEIAHDSGEFVTPADDVGHGPGESAPPSRDRDPWAHETAPRTADVA